MSPQRKGSSGEKAESRSDRIVKKIPLFLSYAVLAFTWLGFIFVVSIHHVLIRRHETWHFAEQFTIFHTLFTFTILSLITASSRPAGQPDQSLAPRSALPLTEPPTSPKDVDEDVPLRYLRNTQWVTSRGSKDRSSPLPLPHTDTPEPSPASDLDMPAISPFPFAASPFVPASAMDAGEDTDGKDREGDEGEGEVDTEQLLPTSSGRDRALFAKKDTGGPRWCEKCDAWKPDRCHHCRWCRRCTLKMDHHCVWLGTCVGYNNYKPFLLFVNYGTLLSIYCALEAGYETYRFFQEPDAFLGSAKPPPQYSNGTVDCSNTTICEDSLAFDPDIAQLDPAPVVFMVLAVLGAFFTLSVGSLAGYHWYLAAHNMTTLENMTHSYPSALLPKSPTSTVGGWKPDHLLTRTERYRLRTEASEINVYDLGWRRNLRELLIGRDRRLWRAFWPLSAGDIRGDPEAGHTFAYDEKKLERLRDLTRELRFGTMQEQKQESDSGDYDDVEELDEEKGYETEIEQGEEGEEAENSEATTRVKWFEA